MKKILLITFFVLGLFVIVGCSNETKKQQSHEKNYEFVEEPKLIEGGDVEGTWPGMKYIVGTIKNKSNKKTERVQINFDIYDEDGNKIGETFDAEDSIEKDGTWKFIATVHEYYDAKTFKITKVKGFDDEKW